MEGRPLAGQRRCGLSVRSGTGRASAAGVDRLRDPITSCVSAAEPLQRQGLPSNHLPRNHCAAQGHQGSLAPFTIKGAPLLRRARTQDPRARPRVTPPAGPVHSGLDRWLGAARPAGAWGQHCALAVQPGGQTGAPSPPAPRKGAPSCARPQSLSAQTPGRASFWTEIIISQSKAF